MHENDIGCERGGQFYRLIDQTNCKNSFDKLVALLHILDCEVDLVVKANPSRVREAG